ncbi:MAG: hypoxanthine phosphoribosyltransferase [Clostridia bacterium]|nr:hypoxanthine phosphoribosyltransferase [Clostridia bacterium]
MTTQEHDSKIKRVIISEQEIQERIKQVGAKISKEYDGKPVLLVSVLKGAFVFMADFCRALTIPIELDFMSASSYGAGTVSSGTVRIDFDLKHDISNYHVIIIEDIIDTGRTLKEIVRILDNRHPLSLKVVTLLDKPSRRVVEFNADESLFVIPDLFVIGYGLDYNEYYRNLPYIAEYDA